jgi:predicted site-specific integrase-resolvase
MPETKFLSIERAANTIGVSHQTLRNWIADGEYQPTFQVNGRPIIAVAELPELKKLVETA